MSEAMDLKKAIEEINPILKAHKMCEFKVVNPKECRGQEINARYMPSEMFQQLINNIKKDSRLESIPLCYEDEKGIIRIISGHHRIKAAEEIQLNEIIVMITTPESNDEIVSKQISHNALTGKDDEQVLNELFNSISIISERIATELNDKLEKINYPSLNFKIGTFKEFVLTFIPEDILEYDEKMEKIAEDMISKSSSTIRIVPMEAYDKFGKILRQIKKAENIKSNGSALAYMVDLAYQKLIENDNK
jgi:hypothetical protein